MKKKIIVITLVLGFVILGCEPAIAVQIEKEHNKIKDEYIQVVKEYANETDFSFNCLFMADGAVHKITNITFIEGPASTLSRLNKLFSKKLFFPIFPMVYLSNLTFTISFDEPVEKRSDSRYWYETSYAKINLSDFSVSDFNMTTNTPHSRTVYNFAGVINFQRPKILKLFSIGPNFLTPYRFTIIGICEDIESNVDSS
jgi:hypothetical protein